MKIIDVKLDIFDTSDYFIAQSDRRYCMTLRADLTRDEADRVLAFMRAMANEGYYVDQVPAGLPPPAATGPELPLGGSALPGLPPKR